MSGSESSSGDSGPHIIPCAARYAGVPRTNRGIDAPNISIQQVKQPPTKEQFKTLLRRMQENAERHMHVVKSLFLSKEQVRREALTDEFSRVNRLKRLGVIDKQIKQHTEMYELLKNELQRESTFKRLEAETKEILRDDKLKPFDAQTRDYDTPKASKPSHPESPTSSKHQLDNLRRGMKTQRVAILSEREVNTVANRLLPLQGITFVGANNERGLTVLIEAAFKASTEPLVHALVGGMHCTIEAVNGFRLHRLERGNALSELSRTVGFVAKVGDTPVLLTAAHCLDRCLSCSSCVDRFVVDTKTEKTVEYFNYHGTDCPEGATAGKHVAGIGVISTCKRKSNEEPLSSNHRKNVRTQNRRRSTGEVDDSLQTTRNRNRITASDLAVLKLDRYVKTIPQNGLAPFIRVIQDPAVLFASHLYKLGCASGLTFGRVKSVNGTLALANLPGVSYRNVLLVEPIAGSQAFSLPGDSGSGVLIDVKTSEGFTKPHAAALVLGGDVPSLGANKPPYALCIMLKDSMDALKDHPFPNVNGLCVEDIRILEATLLSQDENNDK